METSTDNTQETLNQIIDILHVIQQDVRDIKSGHNTIDGQRILEFAEVCDMLRMGERQVRRYRERGALKGFLLDNRRMYWEAEVREFLKKQSGEANKIWMSPANRKNGTLT